jgi:hypothetical protein
MKKIELLIASTQPGDKLWNRIRCRLGFHDWHYGVPLQKSELIRWCRLCYAERPVPAGYYATPKALRTGSPTIPY